MNRKQRTRGGCTLLEFTLVGIPLIFVLVSTFEMARGMWTYHTLSYAVKEGTRYAVVHGQNCAKPPNSCTVTIGQIAGVIQSAGLGLDGDTLSLTFTDAAGTATTCVLNTCIASYTSTAWPPSTENAPGLKVKISASYPFNSVIAMFWPGAGSPMNGLGAVTFPATSRESIQF
jgi:Flp pilus assembly protein TadG